MITPKQFYSTYAADPEVSPIAEKMMELIHKDRCVHALDFGCGEGKHVRRLMAKGVHTLGIDISILNVFRAQAQSMGIMYGDENYLRHFCNADAVFTVSVLDHIINVDGIIQEFQRIANRVVYLLETNDIPGDFYFPHHYEKYGFKKIEDIEWKSTGDGAIYYLWRWCKGASERMDINDDMG